MRSRFFKRGHNLPTAYPEDNTFRTVGEVTSSQPFIIGLSTRHVVFQAWDLRLARLSAVSRASAGAGSLSVGAVPAVKGAATARELKLSTETQR